jgi:hypothetical protein
MTKGPFLGLLSWCVAAAKTTGQRPSMKDHELPCSLGTIVPIVFLASVQSATRLGQGSR